MTESTDRVWQPRILAVLTFQCIVGAGTMEGFTELFRRAGSDAWLSVVAAGAVAAIWAGVVVLSVTLHPTAKPGGLFVTGLGPWVGKAAGLGFVAYLVADAARALRTTTGLLHFAVLPRTPDWALILLGTLISAMVQTGGLAAVVRYQATLFWPTLLLAVGSLAVGFRFTDWANLLPFLSHGVRPVLSGMRAMLEPFLGLELLLVYLLFARSSRMTPRAALRSVLAGTAGALGLHFYVTLAVLTGFGPFEAATLMWPVMEAVRRIYLTGLFFERLDLLFLITLLIATSSALNLLGYAAVTVVRGSFGLRTDPWQVWVLSGLAAALALLPRHFADVHWWRMHVLEPAGLVYLVALPLGLILTGLWRRHGRRRRANTDQ